MDCKKFEKSVVLWLRKKIKSTKRNGIVIGLSGGIDSAVVAALCKKAVGSKKLLCLILPCQSQKSDIIDAKNVAKKLNIKTKTVELTKIYNNLIKLLPKGNRISQANLKPRLRMLTLYYFANKLGYIVAGTGNKSELSVGYFTKYGDGGVDILPIGNLYKSEVRELAWFLEIPERIIKKAPTAGLWSGQTDESEMGITYNKLDNFLKSRRSTVVGRRSAVAEKKLNKKLKELTNLSIHKLFPPEIFRV
ncbi:MAG: NAD+ synthase [Elusimicrobia bacterium]|nr:NAD+ synthase [Elusimicrobiota bacterium]